MMRPSIEAKETYYGGKRDLRGGGSRERGRIERE
jgi:hypothetical protein